MTSTEYRERQTRTAAELTNHKLDALVLSVGPNTRYLTGFTGSNAMVVLTPRETILFTDPRYQIQAAREADCKVRVVRGPLLPALIKTLARRSLRRIAFEQDHLTYGQLEHLRRELPLKWSLEPVSGLVESLRIVKSPAEIEIIRRSVEINSNAFDHVVRKLRPGTSERDIAAELEYRMRLLGAEKPAFDTIVATGERTALPHAQPCSSAFSANRLLLIDMGATREGYASDMTRMAFAGKPGRKLKDLYRAVLEAQLAAISAVRPGIRAEQVDSAARRVLRAHKLDRVFIHSTGHGLGLEIHEPPRIGRHDKTRLAAGMVITIEPGAYLEGFGGVRIEDTVVVTDSGCDVLTPTTKELLIL